MGYRVKKFSFGTLGGFTLSTTAAPQGLPGLFFCVGCYKRAAPMELRSRPSLKPRRGGLFVETYRRNDPSPSGAYRPRVFDRQAVCFDSIIVWW